MKGTYKEAMHWLDSQLYAIEKVADTIGYDHESNPTYKCIMNIMSNIEFNNKTMKPEDWLRLGMNIQTLWQEVLSKTNKRIG